MQDIVNHLINKVKTVNLNNPKANPGSKIMQPFEERLFDYTIAALDIIGIHFNKYDDEFPHGYARLTTVSTAIGRDICRKINLDVSKHRPKDQFRNHLRIGDFFLDSIVETGYADLIRGSETTEARIKYMMEIKKLHPKTYKEHPDYNAKLLNVPYALRATDKWSCLKEDISINKNILFGTTFKKPNKIFGLFQNTEFGQISLIKGWTREDIKIFRDGDLINSPFIQGINKIQQTPWRINKDVLKCVKMRLPEILHEEEEMPEEGDPSEVKLTLARLMKESTPENEKEYNEASKRWNKKLLVLRARSKNYALKTIIQKAEAIDEAVFWQYADCDYRGRLYFLEPYLNFQGNDLARGLMTFADKEIIGVEGIKWLSIHLATAYNQSYRITDIPEWCSEDYVSYLKQEGLRSISVDKMTIEDRIKWTENNRELIESTAKDGKLIGEKPVSFLAACFEMLGVYKHGEMFLTSLPISIDGSNNGWQHLAAISKDQEAAELVSLIDTDIQTDFYVKVAKELLNVIEEEQNERLITLIKKMPMRDIRKGIAKRAAMTRAYSCGAKRMAASMYADCYKENYTEKYNITMIDCVNLSQAIIIAINRVCPGPLATMSYLQRMAVHKVREQAAIDSKNVYLTWWTPSGFFVVYQRNRQESIKHRGVIAKRRIKHVGKIDSNVPDIGAYISGISPNFVHSQDASHLMLVASNWEHSFGAIHDSFSTHACYIEKLNDAVRDYFCRIYDHKNYYEEIKYALSADTFEEEIDVGTLDINEVKNSKYFFC